MRKSTIRIISVMLAIMMCFTSVIAIFADSSVPVTEDVSMIEIEDDAEDIVIEDEDHFIYEDIVVEEQREQEPVDEIAVPAIQHVEEQVPPAVKEEIVLQKQEVEEVVIPIDETKVADALKAVVENTEYTESDFNTSRLLVSVDEHTVVTDSAAVAESSGTVILQYETPEEAAAAYLDYEEKGLEVEPDLILGAADTESLVYTEESNPVVAKEEALVSLSTADVEEIKNANVIALIDSGAPEHPNVIERISLNGESVNDEYGHGTKMVNAIVAINPDAQIISIRSMDASGNTNISITKEAIQYAMERGVSIINLSLSSTTPATSNTLNTIINEAVNEGFVVNVAAGNKGDDASLYTPGNIEVANTIGAANASGGILSSSNRGDIVDYYVEAGSTSEATANDQNS